MKQIPRTLSALDTLWGAIALLAIVALVVFGCMGCSAPEDFVQPGDSFAEAVAKQGPCVGVQRESASEGETWVLLSGGFVVAVFDRKTWDLSRGSSVEVAAGESLSTGEPRVIRVDLDWRALPSAER